MMKQFTKNWWLLTINGVIAVIFGFFAVFLPQGTIITIAKYFGLVILIGGIILLVGAVNNMNKKLPYGILLFESIVSLIMGIIILVYTRETLSLFVILVGIWAVILGILQLTMLTSSKNMGTNKTIILINGLLTLLFGILLFFNPFTAAAAFTFIVGIIALIFGILLIYLSFMFRNYEEA